jgi:hypothetical protein
MKQEILDAINQYHARGWNCIPTYTSGSGNTIPAGKWQQWTTTKQSHQEMIELFESVNHNGVAIVTGKVSDIVVLDVDAQKNADVHHFAEQYNDSLICYTPSGGIHIYFKYEDGVGNRVDLIKGCDLRGDGGIVYAPPTSRKSGSYEWSNFDSGVIGKLPDFVQPSTPGEEREMATDDFLTKIVNEGGRNNHIARVAGYLIGKELPKDVALSFLQMVNKTNVRPPLPEREVENTFNSVLSTNERRAKELISSPSSPVSLSIDDKGSVVNEKFEFYGWDEFMSKFGGIDDIWTIKDWLPSKTILFMVSPPECYKTWLELDLAVSIATGLPFLGQLAIEEKQTGPVLLIQQEDWAGQTAKRLHLIYYNKVFKDGSLPYAIKEGKNDDIEEAEVQLLPPIPIHIAKYPDFTIDNKEKLEGLRDMIHKIRPKLVVIDPLYSITKADNYMSTAAKDMMIFKKLREEYGCTFCFAHHTGKEQEDKKGKRIKSNDRQRIWGSQLLNGFLETGWQIGRVDDEADTISVHRHFKAAKGGNTTYLTFNINDVSNEKEAHYNYNVTIGNPITQGDKDVKKEKDDNTSMNPSKIDLDIPNLGYITDVINSQLKLVTIDCDFTVKDGCEALNADHSSIVHILKNMENNESSAEKISALTGWNVKGVERLIKQGIDKHLFVESGKNKIRLSKHVLDLS